MGITAASFIGVLLIFLIVGVLSIRHKRAEVDDYLTAGHNTAPWVIGLSSVATNNSGYMFIGLVLRGIALLRARSTSPGICAAENG